jgi:hypothetical protein
MTITAALTPVPALTFSTGVTFPLLAPDGTQTAPSYAFTSSSNSGMFISGGLLSFTAGGTRVSFCSNTGCNFNGSNFTTSFFNAQSALFSTSSNCASSASPAVCTSASAGSVAVAASSATLQVNTTAVTANSQIILTEDSSLGARLSVTCNTTPTVQPLTVTARTAATSFTFSNTAPTTNPRCVSYWIIN